MTNQPLTKNEEGACWLPGVAVREISARFFDAEACTDWFIAQNYPAGPVCKRCGAPITGERLDRWRHLQRITCAECGHKIKLTQGTCLQESHLSPREFFALLVGLGFDQHATTTAQLSGVTPETVRKWRTRLLDMAGLKGESR